MINKNVRKIHYYKLEISLSFSGYIMNMENSLIFFIKLRFLGSRYWIWNITYSVYSLWQAIAIEKYNTGKFIFICASSQKKKRYVRFAEIYSFNSSYILSIKNQYDWKN